MQEIACRLQDLLKHGTTVITNMWNYSADDWVSSVYAADVDNDGDIEILLGSRDGSIRALTRWGSLKWEARPGSGHWVSSVIAVPQLVPSSNESERDVLACVIAGSRDGKIYAFDQNGTPLSGWEEYDTGSVVRQIYIHPEQPQRVIVGSESRGVYVLDCVTGTLLCEPFFAHGAITCVFSCDVDNDGELEIIAGSADRYVYILNAKTCELKGKFFANNKVYAIHAARLSSQDRVEILVSTNGKDLLALTAEPCAGQKLLCVKKIWSVTPREHLFLNRLHTITVADINNDGFAEILVGSEDKHFYILDHRGKPLWKHMLDACVSSIAAVDINMDGLIEVITGLEDNQLRVFHIDLVPDLYTDINTTYRKLGRTRQKVVDSLAVSDYMLLLDLVEEEEKPQHKMELAYATFKMQSRAYNEALAILLRLRQQRVQHYWARPRSDVGHIRAFCLGDVAGDPKDEILLGNDEGHIIAIDIEKERILWKTALGKRVWMAQMGTTNLNTYDTLLASLADGRVHVLSNMGVNLHDKELVLQDNEIAWCVYINKQGENTQSEIREILVGTDRNIYLYDANLKEQHHPAIPAPHGVKIVSTCDLSAQGSAEIICAGMDKQVYVYSRTGQELWRYTVQDSIRAICPKDIDGDGRPEILVGSEDRYVYILDSEGHLKWRYYMPHRVLSIDALDVDQDDKCEILIGVADGSMYVLNAEGDQRWKFKANDRVRAVCAKDMNDDGKVEIAVASDDELTLLQVINPYELQKQIDYCLEMQQRLEATDPKGTDPKQTVISLAEADDEYVRAFALIVLAGYRTHTQEDFKLIQTALKDKSLEVRKSMVHAVINLCKATRENDQEGGQQVRRFLYQLSTDPNQELRVTLIGLLHMLTEMDSSLCFEYLERFTHNVDIWVRRAVVRQLDKLVVAYPRQSFRLLLETVQDANEWIRQESGRSLALYFDEHAEKYLIPGLHELLMRGVDPLVIQQMSYSAKKPLVKKSLSVLAKILTEQNEEAMLAHLSEAVDVLSEVSEAGIYRGESVLCIYKEFNQLLRLKNINDVVQYQRVTDPQTSGNMPRFANAMHIFTDLIDVVHILKVYQRREALGDRASSLLETRDRLEDIRKDLELDMLRRSRQKVYSVHLPEDLIFAILLKRWYHIVARELKQLRGEADLHFDLPEQTSSTDEQVTVLLQISNTGRCPADNVCIKLEEGENFIIVGDNQRRLDEVPTSRPVKTEFLILPHSEDVHLSFMITYDDAEKRGKKKTFSDRLQLREFRRQSFKDIRNPYTTGTPIREAEMFFGREDDLEFLKEKLMNTATNTIVMLTGQRRSGKTSLMYQLTNDTQLLSPHCPVFIDLQNLALKSNANQLLAGIASTILETLKARDIRVPRLNASAFDTDPTSTFDHFLSQVLYVLSGNKLLLLFDEFETLEQKMKEGQLDENLLKYLRSLMQHSNGVNFLLAGAPHIRHLTDGYWSTFFNIASHRALSKLKPAEAQSLIEKPVQGALYYDRAAIEKIRNLTGDQPYLIHNMCGTLIRYCNKKKRNYVNTNDVNLAIDLILENGANQFAWIWNQLDAMPAARFVLAVLAQDQGEEGRIFSLADIKEEYDKQGLFFEEEKVLQLLHYLVEEEFIEEILDDMQFRIPVGLIRAWLHKVWPPKKVARIVKLERV